MNFVSWGIHTELGKDTWKGPYLRVLGVELRLLVRG